MPPPFTHKKAAFALGINLGSATATAAYKWMDYDAFLLEFQGNIAL